MFLCQLFWTPLQMFIFLVSDHLSLEWRFWWMEHFLSLISSRKMLETTPVSQQMGYWAHPQPLPIWKLNVSLLSCWHFCGCTYQRSLWNVVIFCEWFFFCHFRSCACRPNAAGNIFARRHGGGHCLSCPSRSPCAVRQLDQRRERFKSW